MTRQIIDVLPDYVTRSMCDDEGVRFLLVFGDGRPMTVNGMTGKPIRYKFRDWFAACRHARRVGAYVYNHVQKKIEAP